MHRAVSLSYFLLVCFLLAPSTDIIYLINAPLDRYCLCFVVFPKTIFGRDHAFSGYTFLSIVHIPLIRILFPLFACIPVFTGHIMHILACFDIFLYCCPFISIALHVKLLEFITIPQKRQ